MHRRAKRRDKLFCCCPDRALGVITTPLWSSFAARTGEGVTKETVSLGSSPLALRLTSQSSTHRDSALLTSLKKTKNIKTSNFN
jgi:hypothetical protein